MRYIPSVRPRATWSPTGAPTTSSAVSADYQNEVPGFQRPAATRSRTLKLVGLLGPPHSTAASTVVARIVACVPRRDRRPVTDRLPELPGPFRRSSASRVQRTAASSPSGAGNIAQVRAGHRHDLTQSAAKDLLAHRGGEPGNLLAGDLRWQSQRARVGDQVDERGAWLRQRVPQGCPDVRGLLDPHGVDANRTCHGRVVDLRGVRREARQSPDKHLQTHHGQGRVVEQHDLHRQLVVLERHQLTQAVSYTHLRAHETDSYLVCRLLLEKKKNKYT